MNKKKFLYIGLGIIAIFVIVLRLLYVDAPLWYDEACSWFTASQSFPKGIIENLCNLDMQHTPLYFFLLHFWMKLFGDSEVSLKFLSFIFSVASLPLAYIVTKKISTKKLAIFATSVIAFSPLLIYFSTEVRMYPMAIFLVLLSLNYIIDYEQKKQISSIVKLVITNILIPYTFVGGILYNIALFFSYNLYLYVNKRKEDSKFYVLGTSIEILCLIPYLVLVSYYAYSRDMFVVVHEGALAFSDIIDLLINFFSAFHVNNVYWPYSNSYELNLLFFLLIATPCYFFIKGYIVGMFKSKGFEKVLYSVFIAVFCALVIMSFLQVCIFTNRYLLFILPPMFILSVIGMSKIYNKNFLTIFVIAFCVLSSIFVFRDYKDAKYNKFLAFKTVRVQAEKFGLNKNDMIILPFGADAPYYFRDGKSSQVLPFDFHKEVRNPLNNNLYDPDQQKKMKTSEKYKVIYDMVYSDKVISKAFYKSIKDNVSNSVKKGNYVMLALYGSDVNALVDIKDLRKQITGLDVVKNNTLDIFLKKYMYDLRILLEQDFNFVGVETIGNYTYIIYKKR